MSAGAVPRSPTAPIEVRVSHNGELGERTGPAPVGTARRQHDDEYRGRVAEVDRAIASVGDR